jgi:pimeloyl-ACP methyl ester carboxylesterase
MGDGREVASMVMREGEGTRVVLVHGAPADAGSWRRLVRSQGEMLEGLEVIAVDRLGYGNSTRGAETSLEAQAAGLAPVMREGCVLVGHSYGGPVVLRAAADYPEMVGGVVLVAGACDPWMQDAVWARQAGDAAGVLLPEAWRTANLELLALTDENRAMAAVLDRVRCPVVVVHGTWDPVCPHDGTVGYLEEALVNADVRVVSLARAGHNLHLSHAGVVAEAVQGVAGE